MTASRHAPRALALPAFAFPALVLPALALLMVAAPLAAPQAVHAQTVSEITDGNGNTMLYMNQSNGAGGDGFVGVNRSSPIGKEVFGVQADVGAGAYGGMYMETTSADGYPFYGYATDGINNMWTYYDGSTGKWHVHNGAERLTVQADGNVGIGTTTPQTQLDVRREVSGSAGIGNHVAFLENPATSSGDVLALKSNASDPSSGVNFISFKDADGSVGAIEGTNDGGVTLTSGNADFAEELPVEKGAKAPRPAEIVGVEGGTVSQKTDGADQVMIASRAPALTGNATPANKADDARRVAVAFIGQVPAKVQGPAQPGDLIVPSGKEDGTARAVSPENYRRAEHGPIVGQAWARKTSEDVGEVTVAVSPGRSGAVAEQLEEQRKTNQKQRAQIENLEKRLAALEAEASAAPASAGLMGSPAGSWGLALLLGLGGLAGGILWQRRS